MNKEHTAVPFQAVYQGAGTYQNIIKGNTFVNLMKYTETKKRDYVKTVLGK